MRFPAVLVVSLIILSFIVDYLLYGIIKKNGENKVIKYSHLSISAFFILTLFVALVAPLKSIGDGLFFAFMWGVLTYISVYAPKIVYLLFYGISLIPKRYGRKRIKPVSVIGLLLSIVIFVTMWTGAFYTKNTIEVKNVDIVSGKIPEVFDGYKIAQFSDLHVGSYNRDTDFVEKVVATLNNLDADLIVFTGDIVNKETDELLPYIELLSQIKAKDGVYTILGNHDYGDYKTWSSDSIKQANNDSLQSCFHKMDWIPLNNEYCYLKHGLDSIALIGVENWGDPPFKTYGNLKGAYPDLNDSNYKILLSHNPAHWRAEVLPDSNIDLMLAGHTHGMQSQISIFGYRFSPAWFRYKEWGGLYSSDSGDQLLYVNIGLGQVALPARFGSAYPEITVLELKSK